MTRAMTGNGGLALLCSASLLVFAWSGAARANLVTNGDFSAGNTGFSSDYTYGNVSPANTYVIGTNPSTAPGAYGDWGNFGDHTTGTGNMLIANGGSGRVWYETITVVPNTAYTFEFFVADVDDSSSSEAQLQAGANGSGIGSAVTTTTVGAWIKGTATWNSGAATSAVFSLADLNTAPGWNDFALDDISLTATVPEPGGVALFLASLAMLGIVLTRRHAA